MFLSPKNACMCQNSISSSDILNIAMKSNSISIKNTLVYALAIIAAALLISFGGLSNSSFSGLTIIPERALAMGGGGGYIPLISPINLSPNPTVPTLDIQSPTCVIGTAAPSIIVSATDPQNYNIRYQIDTGADGTIDQYVPASGYVASGSSQEVSLLYTNAGAQTVRVRAEAEPRVVATSNTYPVGVDCNGGHCWNNQSTADKVCQMKGYDYADTYSITTSKLTGRFCSWTGSGWSCDGSCSSCSISIGEVTCGYNNPVTTTTTEPGLLSEWSDTLTFTCEGEAPPVILQLCPY
tara:strand:- start:910 stop:1794 length:885 start_codon:yes stop_codon:yes gene_type:complete